MSWFRLSLANLLQSPIASTVNVILMALGTASIVLLMLVSSQISETVSRDARDIDLVLGAKGSPVQLILSAVYHADTPPGNINLAEARRWAEDRRVETAIPLSLGDSYRQFRVVGTTEDYAALYDAELVSGDWWSRSMQVVIGSQVAADTGLSLNQRFESAHGFSDQGHTHDSEFEVVGLLEPTGTVLDRLILTSLESVWDVHDESAHADDDHEAHEDVDHDAHDHDEDEHDHKAHEDEDHDVHDHDEDEHDHEAHEDEDHDAHDHDEDEHDHEAHEDEDHDAHDHDEDEHDHEAHEDEDHDGHGHDSHERDESTLEVTAYLLKYRSAVSAASFPRQVNTTSNLMAAAPAVEVNRVLQLVGFGIDGLRLFAWVLIASAALSIFAALYGSLHARRGDIAMLRCLGATRWQVFYTLILEGILLTTAGVLVGLVCGHLLVETLAQWLESARGVAFTGFTWLSEETFLLIGLLIVGIIAAAVPAIQAYRTDVARTLAEVG
ncbi:MAG: FtsX-like permease family protein [Pseudomonadota bacterium]